jgi:predicted RNA-binding Zn-ribbon protein involved in translation (DUF1610 family)
MRNRSFHNRNESQTEASSMSDGFTIGAASYASTLFECPNCKETIDNTAETCRFCGQPVDHATALQAAQLLSKINQACSDASYMKSCALALPVFFVLRYLPFLAMLGGMGFLGLSIGIPIWALRWWLRYGSLQADDAEFLRARKSVKIAGIAASLAFLLLIIVPFFFAFFVALSRR